MEYYVAESFKDYIYDITKAYKNDANKLVVDAKNKCNRCNGSGLAISHIENGKPIPYLNDNGICYACEGKGFLFKTVRLYTEKEFNSMERQKERTAERRLEEAKKIEQEKRAKAGGVKANWLLENGFNENEITYVYIAEDSYTRKDELKNAGWRYLPLIGWHSGVLNITCDEKDVCAVKASEAVEFNMYGMGTWKLSAKDIITAAKAALKAESRSEWVGLEKDKITNLPVVLASVSSCNTRYGWSNIYTFLNGENKIVWFTSTKVEVEKDKEYLLTATVKSHTEYRGEKQTTVTRAKLKEV